MMEHSSQADNDSKDNTGSFSIVQRTTSTPFKQDESIGLNTNISPLFLPSHDKIFQEVRSSMEKKVNALCETFESQLQEMFEVKFKEVWETSLNNLHHLLHLKTSSSERSSTNSETNRITC